MNNLSGDVLIRHLPVLRQQLVEPIKSDFNRLTAVYRRLDQLPHVLGLAWFSITELLERQNAAASALGPRMLKDHKPNNIAFQQLAPEYEVPIFHAVDSFVDAARRTQNALIPYLSLRLKRSLPQSASDLVKGIKNGTVTCGRVVDGLLSTYWASTGHRVKDYRDLAQHFAIIASDVHLVLTPDKRQAFTLTLPNNPEVKSASKLSFDPPVHAVQFIYEAFFELIEVVFDVTKELLELPLPATRTMMIMFRPAFQPGMSVQPLITREEWDGDLEEALKQLNARGVD